MDEPTSNLDAANRAQVLSALRHVTANRTTLIISHDFDLAQQCQRVLYLGQNHEVAFDTHANLVESCPSYTKLWECTLAAERWQSAPEESTL